MITGILGLIGLAIVGIGGQLLIYRLTKDLEGKE